MEVPPGQSVSAFQVLVVEGDGDLREGLVDVLVDEGCQVTAVESATKGLKLLEQQRFDVVLAHQAPVGEMLGSEMLMRARQRCWLTSTRAVLLSGNNKLLSTDNVPVLHEPFDLNLFLALVLAAAKAGRADLEWESSMSKGGSSARVPSGVGCP